MKDVQSTGKVCVLDIDIQVLYILYTDSAILPMIPDALCVGVHSMKKTDLNPVYVFIQPPSMQELVLTRPILTAII